jgi:ribA/ribD-fused uncharacterized protein
MKISGIIFQNTEQYIMWRKAELFGDREISEKILNTDDPKKHKSLGRKVKNFDEKIWDKNKIEIATTGNREKFRQHPTLQKRLISTYPNTLVEASPVDRIWGIGFNEKDALISVKKWGQNLLGKILTKIRDEFIMIEVIEKLETLPKRCERTFG